MHPEAHKYEASSLRFKALLSHFSSKRTYSARHVIVLLAASHAGTSLSMTLAEH